MCFGISLPNRNSWQKSQVYRTMAVTSGRNSPQRPDFIRIEWMCPQETGTRWN